MSPKGAGAFRVVLMHAIAVALAAALAIVVHAALPAPVDALAFDSVLVERLGFPVVAVSYFLLLFTHCAVVVHTFGRGSNAPRWEVGLRFGLAYALLYLVGMQEVVVEASPFAAWGLDFVRYQLYMGLGDAVPVVLLCVTVAYVSVAGRSSAARTRGVPAKVLDPWQQSVIAGSVALSFFVQRTLGHVTGIVESDVATYPVQTLLWTALFGVALGGAYVLLLPLYARERRALVLSLRLVLLSIGANWMWFNAFIGLVFGGAMPQMLLRSGLDVAVMLFASLVVIAKVTRSDGSARPRARRAARADRAPSPANPA